MPLNRVRIQSFRCIESAELELDPDRSYIYGPNGAGKTSLLEAIYLLGRGRSFRTRQTRRLVRRGDSELAVFGEFEADGSKHRLGVARNASGLQLRVDGAAATGMAVLAQILPVHVIEPTIHRLIEGGPSERRRFLDWGVFHVEPLYLDDWRRYRRILSQRNAALKQRQAVDAWEEAFLEAADRVDAARSQYASQLQAELAPLATSLLGVPIEIDYRSGWTAGENLGEALKRSSEKDRTIGRTNVGPHRGDMTVSMSARGVREEVSRGQQKLVAAALVLAQIRVFSDNRPSGGVLLVDDPAAELDQAALEALLRTLDGLPAQLVLTGLSEARLPPVRGARVFHVEGGKVLSMV